MNCTGSVCQTGYHDFLCSRCDSNYYRTYEFCLRCPSDARQYTSIGVVGALAVITILVVALAGKKIVRAYLFLEAIGLGILLLFDVGEGWVVALQAIFCVVFLALMLSRRASQSAGLIKIATFHIQTAVLLIRDNVPDSLHSTLRVLSSVSLHVPGVECSWRWFSPGSTVRLVVICLCPLLLFVPVCALLYVRSVWRLRFAKSRELLEIVEPEESEQLLLRKHKQPRWFWNTKELLHEMLFLCNISYFELTSQLLAVFSCERFGNVAASSHRLSVYSWVVCTWHGSYLHLFCVALCFIVVYVVGLPGVYAILLYKHHRNSRKHAHEDDFEAPEEHHSHIAFLVESWKDGFAWYEVVWILRRLSIAVIVTFVRTSAVYVTLILLLSTATQALLLPFRSTMENRMETLSLLSLTTMQVHR